MPRACAHRTFEEMLALRLVSALALALALTRCGGKGAPPPSPPQAIRLGPEDLVAVAATQIEAGPTLSGTLQPKRIATIRAEAAGAVREVRLDRGQRVSADQVAVVLDDAAQRDQLLAARSAVRSASNALDVALQEEERSRILSQAGGLARRDLERASAAVQAQRAQLADAQARLRVAQQQLGHTRVRIPFSGVLSERPVNQGDIVQVGSPLFTVIDPSTMRLEALVPAERLQLLRPGTAVDFRVAGYGERPFRGRVTHVFPAVDPATGQVRVEVELPNEEGLLGGLFARGRVVLENRRALAVPLEAVDFATSPPTVLRVRAGVAERVQVTLGLRDEFAQRVELTRGVDEGALLVRSAARATVAPGARVELIGPRPADEARARTPRRP